MADKANLHAATAFTGAFKAGQLKKQGGAYKSWKKRWVVLDGCFIYYYKNEKSKEAIDRIDLRERQCKYAVKKKQNYAFQLYHPTDRTYFFVAASDIELEQWMEAIRGVIDRINAGDVPRSTAPGDTTTYAAPPAHGSGLGGSGGGGGSTSTAPVAFSGKTAFLIQAEVDGRLAEAVPYEFTFDRGLDEQISEILAALGLSMDIDDTRLYAAEIRECLDEADLEAQRDQLLACPTVTLRPVLRPALRVAALVEKLTSAEAASGSITRKATVFGLKAQLEEAAFAEEFIDRDGISLLLRLVGEEEGNTQSYALNALRAGMSYVSGMEAVLEEPALVVDLYSLLGGGNPNVIRVALELLFVLCNYAADGFTLVHTAAAEVADNLGNEAYVDLVELITSGGDVDIVANAVTLANSLVATCPDAGLSVQLVEHWDGLGLVDHLRLLAKTEQHEVLTTQLTLFEDRTGLAIFPAAVRAQRETTALRDKLLEYETREPLIRAMRLSADAGKDVIARALAAASDADRVEILSSYATTVELATSVEASGLVNVFDYKTEDEKALLLTIDELESQLADLRTQTSALARLSVAEAPPQVDATVVSSLEREVAALEAENNDLKEQLSVAVAESHELQRNGGGANAKLSDEEIDFMRRTIRELMKEKKALKERCDIAEQDADILLVKYEQDVGTLREKLKGLRAQAVAGQEATKAAAVMAEEVEHWKNTYSEVVAAQTVAMAETETLRLTLASTKGELERLRAATGVEQDIVVEDEDGNVVEVETDLPVTTATAANAANAANAASTAGEPDADGDGLAPLTKRRVRRGSMALSEGARVAFQVQVEKEVQESKAEIARLQGELAVRDSTNARLQERYDETEAKLRATTAELRALEAKAALLESSNAETDLDELLSFRETVREMERHEAAREEHFQTELAARDEVIESFREQLADLRKAAAAAAADGVEAGTGDGDGGLGDGVDANTGVMIAAEELAARDAQIAETTAALAEAQAEAERQRKEASDLNGQMVVLLEEMTLHESRDNEAKAEIRRLNEAVQRERGNALRLQEQLDAALATAAAFEAGAGDDGDDSSDGGGGGDAGEAAVPAAEYEALRLALELERQRTASLADKSLRYDDDMRRLSSELSDLRDEKDMLRDYLDETRGDLKQATGEANRLRANLADAESRLVTETARLAELEAALADARSAGLLEGGSAAGGDLKMAKRNLELEDALSTARDEMAWVRLELDVERKKAAKLSDRLRESEEALAAAQAAVEVQAEEPIAFAAATEVSEASGVAATSGDTVASLEATIATLRDEASSSAATLDQARSEATAAHERALAVEAEAASAREEAEAARAEAAATRTEVEHLRDEVNRVKASAAEASAGSAAAVEARAAEMSQLRADLTAARAELAKLEGSAEARRLANDADLASLRSQVEAAKDEANSIRAESKAAAAAREAEVQALRDEVANLTGVAAAAESARDTKAAEVEDLKGAVASLEAAAADRALLAQDGASQALEAAASAAAELAAAQAELAQVNEAHVAQVSDLEAAVVAAEALAAERATSLGDLEVAVEAAEAAVASQTAAREQAEQALALAEAEAATAATANEARCASLTAELAAAVADRDELTAAMARLESGESDQLAEALRAQERAVADLSAAKEAAASREAELVGQMSAVRDEASRLEACLADLEAEAKQASEAAAAAEEALSTAGAESSAAVAAAQAATAAAEERAVEAQGALAAARTELEAALGAASEASAAATEAADQVAALEAELAETKAARSTEQDDVKETVSNLRSELAQVQATAAAQSAAAAEQIAALAAAAETARNDLATARASGLEQHSVTEAALAEARETVATLQGEIAEAAVHREGTDQAHAEEVAALTASLAADRKRLAEAEADVAASRSEVDDLCTELAAVRSEGDAARAEAQAAREATAAAVAEADALRAELEAAATAAATAAASAASAAAADPVAPADTAGVDPEALALAESRAAELAGEVEILKQTCVELRGENERLQAGTVSGPGEADAELTKKLSDANATISSLREEVTRLRALSEGSPSTSSAAAAEAAEQTSALDVAPTQAAGPPPPAPPPPPPPPGPASGGSGGGPPPPPPPGGMARSAPTKPEIRPGTKMKPIFWKRILTSAAPGETWWETLPEAAVDTTALETVFGQKARPKPSGGGSSGRGGSAGGDDGAGPSSGPAAAPKVTSVLDGKRSNAISFMLAKLPPMDDLVAAINAVDEGTISGDLLRSLISNLATDEEIAAVTDAAASGGRLDRPEEFVLGLNVVPCLRDHLSAWAFAGDFAEELDDVGRPLQDLEATLDAIRTSGAFKTVIGTVLAVGNYCNGGTARGRADGFEFGILEQLVNTKGADGVTVLDFVADELRKADASLMERLTADMAALRGAATVSVADLDSACKRLSSKVEAAKVQAANVVANGGSRAFAARIPAALDQAGSDVNGLAERAAGADAAFRDLLGYLNYSAGKVASAKTSEFLASVASFVDTLRRAWDKRAQAASRPSRKGRKIGGGPGGGALDPMAAMANAIKLGTAKKPRRAAKPGSGGPGPGMGMMGMGGLMGDLSKALKPRGGGGGDGGGGGGIEARLAAARERRANASAQAEETPLQRKLREARERADAGDA